MIIYSFRIKGQRGEYVMNIDYNKTLNTYHLISAEQIENGERKVYPVPLALFNRVYDSKESALVAAQQWINDIDITEGRT